jgi:membrane-bound serine protease (ClpP class)
MRQGIRKMLDYRRDVGKISHWLMLFSLVSLLTLASGVWAQDAPVAAVRYVQIPLPLTSKTEDRVVAVLEQFAQQLAKSEAPSIRPQLVLHFLSAEGTAGEGSEFEAALKLARVLTSERLAGVRTVAFLPRSVVGHAVLSILACEEIIMAPDAELGNAGCDESRISPLLRAGYEDIAQQRRTIPVPVALGMLDRDYTALKVQTVDGVRYIAQPELADLQAKTTVESFDPLPKQVGDMLIYTGDKWRHEFGFVSHLARDLPELATALNVPSNAFTDNPLAAGKVSAVRVNFDGSLNPRLVDRAIKIMREALKKEDTNLLILWLRSEGGSLDEALRLSQFFMSEIDHAHVRTVVYVSSEARGAAAVVALSADELIVEEGAILGSEGDFNIQPEQFAAAIPQLQERLVSTNRSWSPALVLAGFKEPLFRYTHNRHGTKQLFTKQELEKREDRAEWTADVQPLDFSNGIGSAEAVELGLARHRVRDFSEVNTLYRIDGEIAVGRMNWALALIERLANRRLAGLLLFIGTLALFNELAHPGIGVPGFIAGVCFLLFFWSNVLHGNADMLELLLFAAGIACILIELFLAPGAIVFGLGGSLLVIASIVLASQTFVLPSNMYQVRQVPGSLFMVIGAGLGGMVGLYFVQRFLPHTPYLKRLVLRPPVNEELERVQERERLASFDHLLGKYGVSLTPLVPSGKIRVGDEVIDVVSDGTLIAPETPVMIVETLGSRVVVKQV